MEGKVSRDRFPWNTRILSKTKDSLVPAPLAPNIPLFFLQRSTAPTPAGRSAGKPQWPVPPASKPARAIEPRALPPQEGFQPTFARKVSFRGGAKKENLPVQGTGCSAAPVVRFSSPRRTNALTHPHHGPWRCPRLGQADGPKSQRF